MSTLIARAKAWVDAYVASPMRREDGFQTAEAIGIAAVGLLVLIGISAGLQALGVDLIGWMRDTFDPAGASVPE